MLGVVPGVQETSDQVTRGGPGPATGGVQVFAFIAHEKRGGAPWRYPVDDSTPSPAEPVTSGMVRATWAGLVARTTPDPGPSCNGCEEAGGNRV